MIGIQQQLRRKRHVSGTNCNNKEHKVKNVGNSYLRGTAAVFKYKFEVCSWIKLGANTE